MKNIVNKRKTKYGFDVTNYSPLDLLLSLKNIFGVDFVPLIEGQNWSNKGGSQAIGNTDLSRTSLVDAFRTYEENQQDFFSNAQDYQTFLDSGVANPLNSFMEKYGMIAMLLGQLRVWYLEQINTKNMNTL